MIEIKDCYLDFSSDLKCVLVSLNIGEIGSPGSDLFYLNIDKAYPDEWDKKILRNFDIYFRQKGLFVAECLHQGLVIDFLNNFINSFPSASWDLAISQLTNYFYWEFENYRE